MSEVKKTYSPEPWTCNVDSIMDYVVLSAEGYRIARGGDMYENQILCEGNMERAVACVNACEDIEDPADLRRQRDELLAAVTAIVEFWDEAAMNDLCTKLSPDALIGGHSNDDVLTIQDVLQAAIAKATGKEPPTP